MLPAPEDKPALPAPENDEPSKRTTRRKTA
jgi:hypothetical protein